MYKVGQWGVVGGVYLLSCVPVPAADAPGFRDEVLAYWQALARQVRSYTVCCEWQYWHFQDDQSLKMTRKDILRWVFARGGALMETTITEEMDTNRPQETYELVLNNPRYEARLGRSSKTGKYVLFDYQLHESAEKVSNVASPLPWLMCANVQLDRWLASPGLTNLRLERPSAGVIRLRFTCEEGQVASPGSEVPVTGIRSGYLDIEEGEPYRVLKYEFHRVTKFSRCVEVGTLEYAGQQEDFPILRKQVVDRQYTWSKFGVRGGREVISYDVSYNQAIPDEQFRLSHYGLPEPVGVEWERGTPVYVWLFLAAGVLGLLALGLRWLAHRRRTTG